MSPLTSGTIEVERIAHVRAEMLTLMKRFIAIEEMTDKTRQTLCENWVGLGRNEFQVQYELLFSKLSDIGDTLGEMYQAMVDAEAAYAEADHSIFQEVSLAAEDAGIMIDDPSKS